MADALESLTSDTPLVLVLEDLHWSDYSTLDLVSYIARRPAAAQLMILATYRPVDVAISDHPLKSVKQELQSHRQCEEIPLEYLQPETVNSTSMFAIRNIGFRTLSVNYCISVPMATRSFL
jgi:predicted ATPase